MVDQLYGAGASGVNEDFENVAEETVDSMAIGRHENLYTFSRPPLSGSSLYNSQGTSCYSPQSSVPSADLQREQQEVVKLLQQQQQMLAKVISQRNDLTSTKGI